MNFLSLDSDVTTLMTQAENLQDDYYPFPSKLFALLYLLVNSPRPLVSYIYVH